MLYGRRVQSQGDVKRGREKAVSTINATRPYFIMPEVDRDLLQTIIASRDNVIFRVWTL